MTAIEKAIREAVEKGGYLNAAAVIHKNNYQFYRKTHEIGAPSQRFAVKNRFEILLDPSFWQALGQARRWDEGAIVDIEYGDGKFSCDWMWEHKWHAFIHHLVKGKPAESFFASL